MEEAILGQILKKLEKVDLIDQILTKVGSLERKTDVTNVRLDAIDTRLHDFDVRFDGLEGRFDGLEGRFDGLEGRFDGLEGRFDGLETKVNAIDERLDTLAVKVFQMDERMGTFATKSDLRSFKDEVIGTIVDFGKRLERAEQEFLMTYPRFDRIERHVGLTP